jgi:bifunctional non-homologous end joining protein LigD
VAFQRRKSAAVGVKAPFAGFIEPALATSMGLAPEERRDREKVNAAFEASLCR